MPGRLKRKRSATPKSNPDTSSEDLVPTKAIGRSSKGPKKAKTPDIAPLESDVAAGDMRNGSILKSGLRYPGAHVSAAGAC